MIKMELIRKNRIRQTRLMQKGAISSAFCDPAGTKLELFFGRLEATESVKK